jgi:hypothetical protein
VTASKHRRRDDLLLVDGRPRSANRKPRRRRSPKTSTTTPPAVSPELRAKALDAGKVIVTDAAGTVSITDPPRSPQQRRRRRKAKQVDPFVTTRKVDRPVTSQQRSELAALARDRQLNFDPRLAATLTRGQADQLIAKLRAKAKTRHRAHMNEIKTGKKPKPRGS